MCRSTLRLIRNYVRSNKHSGHVLDSPPNTARQVEFPGIPGTNTGDLGVGRAAPVPCRRADSLPGYCPARSGSARAPRLTSRLGRCTSAQCPPAAACRSDGGRRGAARRVGIVPCSCDCGARARPDARPRACVTGASAATAERGLRVSQVREEGSGGEERGWFVTGGGGSAPARWRPPLRRRPPARTTGIDIEIYIEMEMDMDIKMHMNMHMNMHMDLHMDMDVDI